MALANIAALTGWVALCLAVGWIGAQVTRPALVAWYPALAKPAWTPPAIAFPIVWTALYVLMGVAAWLVWQRIAEAGAAASGKGVALRWLPLILFVLQLALNSLWSTLFFGLRSPGLALAEILLLLVAIVATMIAFRAVSALAAGLLLPYLLWAGYATALNFAIWRMTG